MIKRPILIVVAVMVMVSAPGMAADRGFYVGGGLGTSPVDAGDYYPEYAELRFEENTLSFKLFGGYQFSGIFGVEVDYLDLGRFTRRETSTAKDHQKLEIRTQALTATAVGLLPLGSGVSLFGKLGAASWDVDGSASLNGDQIEDLSRTGTDLTIGAGLDFAIKKFSVRVDFDWLDIPDSGAETMFSLNLAYRF